MKKINILLSVNALIVAVLGFSGCWGEPCEGTDTEPLVWITFSQATDHTLVYGEKDKIETRPILNYGVEMPLSLRETKTTLCFIAPGRIDKLTLSYTREVVAESLECGMRVYVSDIKVVEPTTFNHVSVNETQITIYNE